MIWDDAKIDAFDFETSGELEEYALQPWRYTAYQPGQPRLTGRSWLTSMSAIRMVDGRLKRVAGGLFPRAAAVRAYLEEAINAGRYVLTWNGVFDIAWCIACGCGDLVHLVKWLDGMLMWRALEVEPEYDMDRGKKKSFSLKIAVPQFMPVEFHGYEHEIRYHSEDPVDLANLQKYNDRDSVLTWAISKVVWESLTEKQQAAVMIESHALSLVAEANLFGLPIDMLVTRELSAKLKNDAKGLLEALAPHGMTEKVVRSPLQLAKLMYDEWGLPVLKENTGAKTGKISRATDKEVLHELAFLDPRAKQVRDYREALGNDTKFAEAPIEAAIYNGDGRARPQGIIFGTYTGRMTYASKQGKNKDERQIGFALHQEKRGREFRAIVATPPGYTLMEFDAAGQEFRWMAELSGDVAMTQLCQPGEDMHGFMGSQIVGQDYRELVAAVKAEDKEAEQARYLGKVSNLSLQYRTYPKTFRRVARVQYNIPMELPEAQRIHRTYQQTYKGVPLYWDRQIRLVKQLGYAETLAGRRVQVVGNWEGSMSWKMQSTALNYPIQGTGGDQKYLAMQVIKPYLTEHGIKFAWDLHDGIYLWVPDAMVERAAVEIRQLLNNLPYREAWGFNPTVPLPWDCKSGKSWGTLKEWKSA